MSPSPVNLISQPKDLGVSNPNQVQLESGGDNEQFSKTLAKAQQDRQDLKKPIQINQIMAITVVVVRLNRIATAARLRK